MASAARCLRLLGALPLALLPSPASAISRCEQERLEGTAMERYGRNSERALADLGLDAIYIVHYTKYQDRRRHMESWLDSVGLQAYFITGWDKQVATDEDVKCMWPSNRLFRRVALQRHFDSTWLEVRELTLAMKHASAWYWAVKENHRHVLVLEDDAVSVPDFVSKIQGVLANETVRNGYDVLFLGSWSPDKQTVRPGLARDGWNKGGVAYLLSQAGASHLVGMNPVLTGPADHMLSNGGDYPNPPPRRWALRPWPVWQGTNQKNRLFTDDVSNRTYCWAPDMGPCVGRLCAEYPTFVSERMIVGGDGPQESSVRFTNGPNGTNSTVLSCNASRAAFMAERAQLSRRGLPLRGARAAALKRRGGLRLRAV